jgi:hypothetical protein
VGKPVETVMPMVYCNVLSHSVVGKPVEIAMPVVCCNVLSHSVVGKPVETVMPMAYYNVRISFCQKGCHTDLCAPSCRREGKRGDGLRTPMTTKTRSLIREASSRSVTANSYTWNVTHNTENTAARSLKPERWGFAVLSRKGL